MPKYYIKSGTLELIFSTDLPPIEAAMAALWECNSNDELDEFFYIDERSMRNYISADSNTRVISTDQIMKQADWKMEE